MSSPRRAAAAAAASPISSSDAAALWLARRRGRAGGGAGAGKGSSGGGGNKDAQGKNKKGGKKGRDKIHFDDEIVESLAGAVEDVAPNYDSRLDALQTCIDELPDRQRDIVTRRYLNSESVQDIASDLGFKANAASQLLFRARANLLKCINRISASSPS